MSYYKSKILVIIALAFLFSDVYANTILAEGVRAKFGFIKVYKIKLIADVNKLNWLCNKTQKYNISSLVKDKDFLRKLSDYKNEWLLHMEVMRDLDGETVANAIAKALESRLIGSNKQRLIEDFTKIISSKGELREGDVIKFRAKKELQDYYFEIDFVNKNSKDKIKSKLLINAFFAIYLDQNSVIDDINKHVISNLKNKFCN